MEKKQNKVIGGYKVTEELVAKSELYSTNKDKIKSLTNSNKTIKKDILDLFLKELKELKKDSQYIKYSKKAMTKIIGFKLETKLHSDLTQIIRSVAIYIISNSTLDFTDSKLSTTKFVNGMKLINKGEVTRFKSNKALFDRLKENELLAIAKKLGK